MDSQEERDSNDDLGDFDYAETISDSIESLSSSSEEDKEDEEYVRARKLCIVLLFPKLNFFFNCFATKKDSIDFIIPTKTLTKLTVRPQRCCATTRLKHGVMD